MLKPWILRHAIAAFALACALSLAACKSLHENSGSTSTAPASSSSPAPAQQGGNAAGAKLNLNTASEQEFLAAVPGLGNRMVHEFLEYRPYRSIQQFRREMGKYVGSDQITEYEKYVYVPISVNEADAATIQQIPGVDATEAEALVAARPYASNEAFLSKLAQYVSEADLAVARTYLSQ